MATKNRIKFGKTGAFSGMNLDTITMRMHFARSECRLEDIRAKTLRCAMCIDGMENKTMRCSNCSAMMVSMDTAFHCHNCGNFVVKASPTLRDAQCDSSEGEEMDEERLVAYILGRKYHCVCCENLQTEIGLRGIVALKEYDGMICSGIEDMLYRYRTADFSS